MNLKVSNVRDQAPHCDIDSASAKLEGTPKTIWMRVQPQYDHLGVGRSFISMFSMLSSRFSIASSRSRIRFSSLPESSGGKSTKGAGQGFGQCCFLSGLLGNAGGRADSSLFFFINYTTVTLCADIIRMLQKSALFFHSEAR